MLELESLQLDIKTLQKYQAGGRTEFLDFSSTVAKSFVSVQNNFDTIQSNFENFVCNGWCQQKGYGGK